MLVGFMNLHKCKKFYKLLNDKVPGVLHTIAWEQLSQTKQTYMCRISIKLKNNCILGKYLVFEQYAMNGIEDKIM